MRPSWPCRRITKPCSVPTTGHTAFHSHRPTMEMRPRRWGSVDRAARCDLEARVFALREWRPECAGPDDTAPAADFSRFPIEPPTLPACATITPVAKAFVHGAGAMQMARSIIRKDNRQPTSLTSPASEAAPGCERPDGTIYRFEPMFWTAIGLRSAVVICR